MPRFTIRDLLWLMVVVGIAFGWLADLDRIRRGRDQLAKREAELASENKMWKADANRASLKQQDATELNRKLELVLEGHGIDPNEARDPRKMSQYLLEKSRATRARIMNTSRKEN